MNKKSILFALTFLSLFLIASLSSAYYYPPHYDYGSSYPSYTSVQNSKSYYAYNNEKTAKYYLSNYDLYYRPIFSAPRERDFGHGVQYVRFRIDPVYYKPVPYYAYTQYSSFYKHE